MMQDSTNLRSFDHIWNKVIQPVSATVLNESDSAFAEHCELRLRSDEEWRDKLYAVYQFLRKQLKDICYGYSDHSNPDELLDGRKIAAALCASLVSQKGFRFDSIRANEFAEQKKKELISDSVIFNKWAIENVYINYKLAYYASLQLVYLTLMRDLLVKAGIRNSEHAPLTPAGFQEQEDAKKLAQQLNQWKHLAPYPQPHRGDGFDVNIIIGLARTDMAGNDLDMFMFAMQLYQIEAHTIDLLKKNI